MSGNPPGRRERPHGRRPRGLRPRAAVARGGGRAGAGRPLRRRPPRQMGGDGARYLESAGEAVHEAGRLYGELAHY